MKSRSMFLNSTAGVHSGQESQYNLLRTLRTSTSHFLSVTCLHEGLERQETLCLALVATVSKCCYHSDA